jgi:hypothetical protein
LQNLERNIITASNIVADSELALLHEAIEYFTIQLEANGLLANQ